MPTLVAPPLSLYLHFPWCVRKCPYCDFNSYALNGELAEAAYVDALRRDLEQQAPQVQGREIISIFMGGGTPSLFSPDSIAAVLEAARANLTFAGDVEVTMEANPGTIERGRFAEYRAAGINRVSLGAQSFNAERLKILGRIHSPAETQRAAEELHSAGVANFNLDLMYALPGQTTEEALCDVETALTLKPAHLSHYQLTLEPGTVFAAQPPDNLPDDDIAADILAICSERMAEQGFAQYEVSAYAKEGRRCRHNLNYWTFGDYLGVGAGAHGKLTFESSQTIVRTTHQRDPRRYLTSINATTPGDAPARAPVPPAERPFEFMLNALRLLDGFDIPGFTQKTGIPWEQIAPTVHDLAHRHLLAFDQSRVRATSTGLRFLNNLLLSFLAETPQTTGSFGLSTTV
jgi:putative oxygen-independent coproporphyrinogen III oxidase